ncbi:MAG: hypothetical protein WC694_00040 [Candidatus Paceibacterota bacterium]|jgi:hypothetical protein
MKNLNRTDIAPLIIILLSIILVFVISRTLTYLILTTKTLPSYLFIDLGFFRLHHFVYGNILITITSFFAIGLGIKRYKNWFTLFYGIGLGLVLDEFLLWMGDTKQLTSKVLFIPYSATVIAIVSLTIVSIIMIKLYENTNNKKITEEPIKI